MTQLILIGLKMLASDLAKFYTLVFGITLAVFLMMQSTAIFEGVMHRLASHIFNINAPIYVMDPSVNSQEEQIPIHPHIIDLIRSIQGVSYATPLLITYALLRTQDHHFHNSTIVGLDDTTLFGHPQITQGNLTDILKPQSYIGINNADYAKIENPNIGTQLYVDEKEATIVSLGQELVSDVWGWPTLYTTYSQSLKLLPKDIATMNYILVIPKSDNDISYIKERISDLGYLALTQKEFIKKNADFYMYQTGFGTDIWILVLFCFCIGLFITAQTFYMFILENIMQFGALKAMGARPKQLISIILFQSMFVGFIGYGIGLLFSSLLTVIAQFYLPNYTVRVTSLSLLISFILILAIIALTSYLGIRKVTRIEPFSIFRR